MLDSISQSLNLDWTALLLNAGVFVVLLIIMDRIFWKPMMAHIAKRNQRIADASDWNRDQAMAWWKNLRQSPAEDVKGIDPTASTAHRSGSQAMKDLRATPRPLERTIVVDAGAVFDANGQRSE